MGLRLNNNMLSLSAFNTYKKSVSDNATAIGRISSGLKLNASKDNPQKVGRSENFRIQIKALESANRSIQDSTSMMQTADGALQEYNNMLSRMKELTVSAADGTKSEGDIKIIQEELNQLKEGLTDLVNNTEFNGVKLIGNEKVQNNKYPVHTTTIIGANAGEEVQIPYYNLSIDKLGGEHGSKLSDIDVSTNEGASKAIEIVDEAIKTVSNIRGKYGALSARFESTAENVSANSYIMESAYSDLVDTDIASEMAEIAKTQILTQTGTALIAQTNQIPQDALRILQNVK